MLLTFAWRNLTRQRSRTAMTLASIIFGVVGLILSGGFVEDIFVQLREATISSRLGHLQVYRDGFRAGGSRAPFDYLIKDADALEARMAARPEVRATMERLTFFGLLDNGRSDLPIVGEGVEPSKEAAQLGSFFRITAGRQLEDTDEYGILLGEGLAESLNVNPGDPVTVMATTAGGAFNALEFTVIGAFRTFSKDFDARAVRVMLPTAQDLVQAKGVHAIVASLHDTLATDAVAAALRADFAGDGLELFTWDQLDDFYANTTLLYRAQLKVLQAIILLVVLLSVANSVSMSAYERVGEFGTLKALGRSSGQIARLVILENLILGTLGATLGVVIGIALAKAISAVGIPMPPPPNANSGYTAHILVVPPLVAVAFAVGFSATVLSSLFAARGATRVTVVDALRENI